MASEWDKEKCAFNNSSPTNSPSFAFNASSASSSSNVSSLSSISSISSTSLSSSGSYSSGPILFIYSNIYYIYLINLSSEFYIKITNLSLIPNA